MNLKQLRGIAHHLDVIVTVADASVREGVLNELDRALTDHELVKVRVNVSDLIGRQPGDFKRSG